LERGYHRSTLDDIADAAGFTKGAVYARFAGKDELFLTLLDAWIDERVVEIEKSVAGPENLETYVARRARRMVTLRRRARDWSLWRPGFWAHAARDARRRRGLAARHNQLLQQVAQALERKAAAMGQKLALSAMDLARAGSAMGHGVALERLADPEHVP